MKKTENLTKIALGGVATSLIAAHSADAQIVYFDSDNSFSFNAGDAFKTWDIDGDGGIEFNFERGGSSEVFLEEEGLFNDGNADFLKNKGGGVQLKSMTTQMWVKSEKAPDGFSWGPNFVSIVNSYGSLVSSLHEGQNYIGFQFQSDGDARFGWASLTITASGSNWDVSVDEWAYDLSGDAIRVGSTSAIPEPSDAALGLGLLALGAVGVSRYRRQRES